MFSIGVMLPMIVKFGIFAGVIDATTTAAGLK